MSQFRVNVHEAVYSLSNALDLVGVTHIHHGKRVAFIAAEIARQLGWPQPQIDTLFLAAILHDCGVSRTAVHAKLAQLAWEEEGEHCRQGAQLLSACPLLAGLAPLVALHHTHWSDLQNAPLSAEQRLQANCIYLADRVDILTLQRSQSESDILLGKEAIRAQIRALRDHWFAADLVDAFLVLSQSEAFWFMLEAEHVGGYVSTWLTLTQPRDLSFAELRSLMHLFSVVVDAKSPFTREHSEGVARLARAIAQGMGLGPSDCECLELAGLLHDLGKLRVPDELLEKPGPLNEDERRRMSRHSFDTFNVLRTIHGLERIAQWASQHHERVNGSGYPFHTEGEGLSLQARILAVADVFQALAQNRPYRAALPPEVVLEILQKQVFSGKIDGQVVDYVAAHLADCWQAAVGHTHAVTDTAPGAAST